MNDESTQRRRAEAEADEQASQREASCPDCGHDAVGELSRPDRLIARLRGRRLSPSCPEWLSSVETGVGLPGQCGCSDPWHS